MYTVFFAEREWNCWMRKLLMIRHGMTEANEKRLFSGSLDLPLSANGREKIAQQREHMPGARAFFTSGMLRAVQTLEILYGNVASFTIPDLAEYRFGTFEMRSHDDLYETEPVYRQWLSEDALDVACPGGETRRAFQTRVHRGFAQLVSFPWEGMAVLVAHGGVIHELAPLDNFPANGEGALLTLSEDGAILHTEPFKVF